MPRGLPPGPTSHFRRPEERPLISSGLGACWRQRLELPLCSHGAQDRPGRVGWGSGGVQGPLLHPPTWPSLPRAPGVGKASLWVSRQGLGSQGWGSSRAALCVCHHILLQGLDLG